jgi:hypothetical protein
LASRTSSGHHFQSCYPTYQLSEHTCHAICEATCSTHLQAPRPDQTSSHRGPPSSETLCCAYLPSACKSLLIPRAVVANKIWKFKDTDHGGLSYWCCGPKAQQQRQACVAWGSSRWEGTSRTASSSVAMLPHSSAWTARYECGATSSDH